jgi:hypothetical protein
MDSSRIGLFGQGCVVMILAACAGCSSSSSTPPPGGSSSGGSSSGGSGDGGTPLVVGDKTMACMTTFPVATSVLVSLTVKWGGQDAITSGTGTYYLSLLSVYSVDSNNNVTGTTTPCGTQAPDVTLSDLGAMATGVPSGSEVRPVYPAPSFAGAVSTNIKGVVGGQNVGSSFEIDPTVSLTGIAGSSPLGALTADGGTTMWPPLTGIPQSDWTYIDGGAYVPGQGVPGLSGIFYSGATPFILPRTALSTTAPQVDHAQFISRIELGLYGLAKSCTETSGMAMVATLDNHIVGCTRVVGSGTPPSDGGACADMEYSFIDSNTTVYKPQGGTFDAKQLTGGASATCADALTALPIPAPGM